MSERENETQRWLELQNASQAFNNNISVSAELQSDWGPKRDPLYIVVPLSILYTIIFITGVVGNVSTCIVISRNKSMHTATNYYLFSLAISDLLLLISGLPPEIYSMWSRYPYIFGETFCIMQGFAAETSANATVLTITAFTIERYVAICHPFKSHTMSKLSRAIRFVMGIWIVAVLCAIPQAVSFGIVYEESENGHVFEENYVCSIKDMIVPKLFEISTMVFFVTPLTAIIVLYILIGLQLRSSTVGPSRGNSVKLKHRVFKHAETNSTQAVVIVDGENGEKEPQHPQDEEEGRKNYTGNSQATKHVVKMLVAVVVAFFICWAPFHAQRLLAIHGHRESHNMVTAFRILTYVSGILYYMSTSVNPFLYHIMSHKFREAFKDTFKGFFGRSRHPKGSRCYSTLSGRSSQLNSHSNTDSCSRQSSLRYLEAEMAKLHDSKRPLVVSFRRKRSQYPRKPKQVTILDAELQEALDNLKDEPEIFAKMRPYKHEENSESVISYVEVHSLQPKHICPNSRRSSRLSVARKDRFRHRQGLTKSSTMPHIVADRSPNGKVPENGFIPWDREEKSNSCSQLESFKNKAIEVT